MSNTLCESTFFTTRVLLTISYHSSAEAFASMLTDLPYKIVNAIFFNLIIYFLPNLRREVGTYFLIFRDLD